MLVLGTCIVENTKNMLLVNQVEGPHSQIFNDRGGGERSDRGSYFIPKKITTSESVYPKITTFFSIIKIIPLSFFSQPKKSFFHRPKKSLLVKISDPKKNHSDPPPLPPSLKYVSGAPGILAPCSVTCYPISCMPSKRHTKQ